MAKGKKTGGRDFKKGEVANPNGRPKKGHTLTEALENAVDKDDLAKKLVAMAMGGDVAALKYVYDRVEGRPRETIDQNVFQEYPQGAEVLITIMDELRENRK